MSFNQLVLGVNCFYLDCVQTVTAVVIDRNVDFWDTDSGYLFTCADHFMEAIHS